MIYGFNIYKAGKAISNDLFRFLSEYKIHHLIFWIAYVGFYVLINSERSVAFRLHDAVMINIFQAAAVYTNFYILMPRHLFTKRYSSYLLLLAMLVLLTGLSAATALYLRESQPSIRENIISAESLIGLCMSAFFTIVLTMALKLILQWYKQEKTNKALARESVESELKFLKSQIQPHFLFNILNTIYSLSLQKSDKTPDVILKFSEFLRYVLYDSSEKKVPLEKEINYMRNYIDLEKLRQGDRANIRFEISQNPENYSIEPLLLLPFLENSFKHGINSSLADSWVDIKIETMGSKINFQVENSLFKKNSASVVKSGGIGIGNVKRRLELLYPGKYSLDIKEGSDSYKVHLTLNTDEN